MEPADWNDAVPTVAAALGDGKGRRLLRGKPTAQSV